MENFIKPFLENGIGSAFAKAPVEVDYSSEHSIIKFVQKIIFKHNVLVEFKKIIKSACSSESFCVENDVIKKIIKGLNGVLLSDENVQTKADVFRYVFKSFISSCSSDEGLYIVQFFLILSQILGINSVVNNVHNNKGSVDCNCIINMENFKNEFGVNTPSLSSDSFLIFKELLLCFSKTSVNVNAFEVQSYSKWLQCLIRNLADSRPLQNIFMEIFYIVAEIDFKLIEVNLEHIFCNIFSQGVPVNENFPETYAIFLATTFKISTQFQRAIKFISKFLSSLKATPTLLAKEIILPSDFVKEFSKAVSVASNQQSLSLLDVLVKNTEECFNFISQNDTGLESPLLFFISELFISFFKDVKLFAPSIASTTLQSFIDKMNFVKETLQKFGDFLFSNKSFMFQNENIVKIFLELCFYCGEIEILLNCYKSTVLDPSDIKKSDVDRDWQCCISSKQWKKLINFVLKSKLVGCDFQCFQLAVQKLRDFKLQNVSLADDSTVKIIIHVLTSDSSKFNIFQQLSPGDFTILMNVLTIEQSKTVTGNIFKQLQGSDNKTERTCWLSNSSIQENPAFIGFLFSEILKNTGSLLLDLIAEKHSSKITWFTEDYFSDEGFVSVEIVDELPEKINAILKTGKKLRKFITKKKSLARNLEVFKSLPLFCMKEGILRLGLSFAVAMGALLAEDEDGALLAFESIFNFLSHDSDASLCFNIGIFIECFSEFSYQDERTDFVKLKIVENLIRNSPKMKFGLNQIGEVIDSPDSFKSKKPMKMLQTQILLYNELGKCWLRGRKRKSENDLIGSYRSKLAKVITDESKDLPECDLWENSKIFLKILAIEINMAVKTDDEKKLKNLMERKFLPFLESAVKSLKKTSDEASIILLIIVLQLIPKLREFLPENSVLKLWKALKTQEKINWKLFYLNTTTEEFNKILDDLLKVSQKFLYSNSDKGSIHCFDIWVSFFDSNISEAKKNTCLVRVQDFFDSVYDCGSFLRELPPWKKVSLVKFFSFCLTSKEIILTSHMLDTIIHVILECVIDESSSTDDFVKLFSAEVDTASAIIVKQFDWSKSKIHLNYLMFQQLLKSFMRRCDPERQIVDEDEVIKLSACAFSLERWVSLMVKKEKDFARISPYFITALVSSIASVTVLPAIKIHLTNCINHFLTVSDSHTISYLLRMLKPGYQQVFNTLYAQFIKYHKYSGKV